MLSNVTQRNMVASEALNSSYLCYVIVAPQTSFCVCVDKRTNKFFFFFFNRNKVKNWHIKSNVWHNINISETKSDGSYLFFLGGKGRRLMEVQRLLWYGLDLLLV